MKLLLVILKDGCQLEIVLGVESMPNLQRGKPSHGLHVASPLMNLLIQMY